MMKKILMILTVLMISFNAKANQCRTYERLIHSIAQVESQHNPKAVSKRCTYVGYLQISKGCVDECNRLIGRKKYKYSDRYDKIKSIEMFHIIQNRYNPKKNLHLAIRIWNEGIGVVNKKYRMTPYMKKVLRVYDTSQHLEE